jgi:four helix bundle protein
MKIRRHTELEVYKIAFEAANMIFEISKTFPKEEMYSLTDQIRRSSRSVCTNLTEAFRRRRYPKSFVSKLVDVEAEAAETQTWLDFALKCKYIREKDHGILVVKYDQIIGKLVIMSRQPEKWAI